MHSLPSTEHVHSLGSRPLERLVQALRACPTLFEAACLHESQHHQSDQHGRSSNQNNENAKLRSHKQLQIALLPSVRLSLSCIDLGSDYELKIQSADEIQVNIPLQGQGTVDHGKQSLRILTGQILLVGPFCRVRKKWDGPSHILALHIPLGSLANILCQPVGHSVYPLLAPITLVEHVHLQKLLGLIEILLLTHSSRGRASCEETVAEFAERFLVGLLIEALELTQEPRPRDRLPVSISNTRPKPYYVSRAEKYILAHFSNTIRIDDLVATAGVSRRTLQYGFQSAHGTTPLQYLRKVRLESARAALLSPAPSPRSISDVAADCGYFNMSQFSRDYRAMFGESASDTAALRLRR